MRCQKMDQNPFLGILRNSLPSLGHLPRFQLKVLKWTENPFAWRNFGPAPEIGTLSEATPKSEGETFLTL